MVGELSVVEWMALSAYSCALWSMQPLVVRKLRRRARQEPEYGMRMDERFGIYNHRPGTGWLWIHSVSLGETRAAGQLIAQLREQRPGIRLLLTHGTASGCVAGRALLQSGDCQAWFPWDTPGAVHRFLAHFQPRAGLLLESEIWPNMMQACARRGIPLFLVNGRLNKRSYADAVRLGWLAQPAYRALSGAFVQTRADAGHLAALGAEVYGVTGNVKFDAQPVADHLRLGRAWRASTGRPVLLLASSREGEEAALVAALLEQGVMGQRADEAFQRVQIMVVPRHTTRVDEVEKILRDAGLSVSRRSQWNNDGPAPADVWLGDTMGEMTLYYAMSDVALLGGSFERHGGQNLIESAAAGCPIVLGPHLFNFAEAAELALQEGAACSVSDMPGGVARAVAWMRDIEALQAAQRNCLQFAGAHQGASRKTVRELLYLLDEPGHFASARSTPALATAS